MDERKKGWKKEIGAWSLGSEHEAKSMSQNGDKKRERKERKKERKMGNFEIIKKENGRGRV